MPPRSCNGRATCGCAWTSSRSIFDLGEKRARLVKIDQRMALPGFWDDPAAARQVSQQHTHLKNELETWARLDAEAQDAVGLAELLDDGDLDMIADVGREVRRLESTQDRLEVELLLGGQYDRSDAFVTIQSGAGGTEAQDWAEMLLRMYRRWAESRGYRIEVVDLSPGEEAGIKSATLRLSGDYAYGYAKAERGVHRLVRMSPFDAGNRRHTSFARVDVVPVLNDDVEIDLTPSDLRVDTFRASGAGGQYVNKTDSAVRITHVPTGISVSSQNQRSQHQNREVAMQVLRARLLEKELAEREAEQARLRGDLKAVDFGSQIRSYVLHPYRMVKDNRTGLEISNPQRVLDGDLDSLIESYLRALLAGSSGEPA